MTLPDGRQEADAAPRSRPVAVDSNELSLAAHLAAGLAGVIGLCALAGWISDVSALRRVLPGQPLMGFNTAACLTLLGLAWFLPRVVRWVCAAVAGVVALAVLVEYVFGLDRGVDQLLFDYPGHMAHPGRMAVATALSVILLAAGRVLMDLRRARQAQLCASAVILVAALTLLGHGYDVSWLYSLRPVSSVSLLTPIGLLLLGLAVLVTVPSGVMRWSLHAEDAGAILTRRLLPVALIALPVVGWIGLVGERHDLYGPTTSAALIVVTCVVIVGAVTWAAAVRLSRADRSRAQALAELTDLKIDLERQVQKRAVQLQRRRNEIAVLEDRQRIAADLHDIVIQRLFAAGMFLEGGATSMSDPAARDRVDVAVGEMDAAIKDLRASIFELGGKRESPTDLPTAMDDVCVESARVLGFLPDLVVDDPRGDAERVRDDILAVLREALANIARHAQASETEVVLRSREGVVSLWVTDDGVGMAQTVRSSGVRNMIERARDHGGDCTWSQVYPSGTRVHWYMPLRAVVGH